VDSYSHSAIPTWSGFIYQGHIALYHSICCLLDGEDFRLQLDSVEDFSIFQDGIAKSTHQVKALALDKREAYLVALEKASSTHLGCDASTQRYFHVSSKLDDTSDFKGKSGNTVRFYSYDKKPGSETHCYLHEVEGQVKSKIEEYLGYKGLLTSDFLLDFKFDLLQGKIASHIVLLHAYNQDGLGPIAELAYTQTITSNELELLLQEEVKHPDDIAYSRAKAQTSFYEHFYNYINSDCLEIIDHSTKEKLVKVINTIKSLDEVAFTKLWKSLCFGSTSLDFDNDRVYDYVDIILDIKKEPILADIPPYYRCLNEESFLPTSIALNKPRREIKFAEDLIKHIRKDAEMIDILVEYEWLIAACAEKFSPAERFCKQKGMTKDALEEEFVSSQVDRKNITKALNARIISSKEAKDLLDD